MKNSKNSGNGSQSKEICPCRTRAGIRKRIRDLHDNDRLSFPKIAALSEFLPIPPSTLNSIYHGGQIPKKWHDKLNHPPPRPPRIAIRLDDPPRAATTILKHMEPELVKELIELLEG